MDSPYLITDTLFVLSFSRYSYKEQLACDRVAVDRYFLRDNLRYVRVHTSTSDYLSSTIFFFLPPPNEQMVLVPLKPTLELEDEERTGNLSASLSRGQRHACLDAETYR
jgi:hypothetical protein